MQKNPVTTDDSGKYSFLTPPGTYYLEVKAKGYNNYKSDPILVQKSNEIHMNIELKKASILPNWLNLYVLIVIIVVILIILSSIILIYFKGHFVTLKVFKK